MGFKGFNAYIKKKKKYFQECELHSSVVVIDGNNIASILYRQAAKTNYVYNGDYNLYAEAVHRFFEKLISCKIEPLVILDGGYELRKLNAIQARLLYSTKDISRHRKEKNSDPFIPLLMIEVFKETLRDMKIKFAQSRFEADADLIELSRLLKCPLLSSDSDFYLYDVPFIPFTSLNFPLVNKSGKKNVISHIPCKIFCVDLLLKDYGGLPNRSYLALLAVLLGDYMEVKHFKKLYLSLMNDEEKSNKLRWSDYDRLLTILFDWFRKVDNFNAAVSKIEESVPLQHKRFLKKQLKLLVDKQTNPVTSPTVELFYSTGQRDNLSEDLSARLDALHVTDNTAHTMDDSFDSKLITCLSPTGKPMEIPEWFVLMERQGYFSRHISNILNLRTVLLWTQLESFDLPSVHVISFPILGIVAGILLSTSKRKRTAPLSCYVRAGCDIKRELLIPNFPDESASFDNLFHLSLVERKEILLRAIQIANFSAENILEHWSLFFLALIYWFEQSQEPLNKKIIFLGAFTFSFLLLTDQSSKNQNYEATSEPLLDLSYKNSLVTQNIINQSKLIEEQVQSSSNIKPELVKVLHRVKSLDLSGIEFDRGIMHFYAEFQTIVQSLLMLNSILNHPFPPIVISGSMSGSLIYNLVLLIRRSSSLLDFVSSSNVSTLVSDFFLNSLKFIENHSSCQVPLHTIKFF